MKKLLYLLALAASASLVACGQSTPTPNNATPTTVAALPTSAAASEIVPLAQQLVQQLVAGDFAGAEQNFDTTMQQQLPADKLKDVWNQLLAQVGAFQRVAGARTETVTQNGVQYEIAYILSDFAQAAINVRVVFDAQRKIAGLFFQPGASATPQAQYTPPAYDKPSAYADQPMTIGSGTWAVSGTLSLPEGLDFVPAVVLVHGSGAEDRDETIGPNKPFRDLAVGLASQGIAVLRYDKRTFAHGAEFATLKDPTVKEETVDDALAAVAALRQQAHIYKDKIFVIGHSLGGTLAPRIGAGDPQLAGLITLAGGTRALEDAIVEQYTYIFMLDGTISADEQKQLDLLNAQRQKVRDPNLSTATPSSELPLGVPASYWLDLRSYNPLAVATSLKLPMLILQGERDYQVTMAEFQSWKTALTGRSDATFKSYPALNHLFIPGQGQITPTEYTQPGNVSPEVIDDIAAWIKKTAP